MASLPAEVVELIVAYAQLSPTALVMQGAIDSWREYSAYVSIPFHKFSLADNGTLYYWIRGGCDIEEEECWYGHLNWDR